MAEYRLQLFNPRFPRGKRPFLQILKKGSCHFQSTLPAGEATRQCLIKNQYVFIFQSTLPAGEATKRRFRLYSFIRFSIHASRGGSDQLILKNRLIVHFFNPRFPRGKRHSTISVSATPDFLFNPRFPRGKRRTPDSRLSGYGFFNPRFPRGKRRILLYGRP